MFLFRDAVYMKHNLLDVVLKFEYTVTDSCDIVVAKGTHSVEAFSRGLDALAWHWLYCVDQASEPSVSKMCSCPHIPKDQNLPQGLN